ncbi:hypothetical protein EDEG_02619 [Edhazardia aedis USNM 41457]|uniref:Cullin family profile domain-containing protein n=1 Tax=Edhazardia aedis (strain USNM 41457) TaxID=1003232 RepID=J9DK36_EDHAE|nr:hypothetical protein EDEG_02619 [Edhazardia aedis USNM 41457]|eukprot:EJW02975.1 hypothetical protein EDEG_02619 [Edhazardia aedis USNM 41457]
MIKKLLFLFSGIKQTMNIGKSDISEDEFEERSLIILREIEKMSRKMPCSGAIISENIYCLLTSSIKDCERLYWRIGDFFNNLCKEKRSIIASSPDWFSKYSQEFLNYSYCVEHLNNACFMLNRAIKNCNNGRDFDDFAFLVWEKGVIRTLEQRNNLNLTSELLRRLEFSDPSVITALHSLRMIVPEPENPSLVYQLSYENRALEFLKSRYTQMFSYHDFDSFMATAFNIYKDALTVKFPHSFLTESAEKISKMVDEIVFRNNEAYVKNGLIFTFSCGPEECKKFVDLLSGFTDKLEEIAIAAVKEHITNILMLKIEIYDQGSQLSTVFVSLKKDLDSAVENISYIFGKHDKIINDICKNIILKFKTPPFSQKFAQFCNEVQLNNTFDNYCNIIEFFMHYVVKDQEFYKIFIKGLSERLLYFKSHMQNENRMKEIAKLALTKTEYNRVEAMLQDMRENDEYNKYLFQLYPNYLINNPKDSNYYIQMLKLCSWPISETSTYPNIKLPSHLNRFLDIAREKYKDIYKKRKFTLNHDLGYADVVISSDSNCKIRLNTYQYIVMHQFNKNITLSCQEIAQNVGLTPGLVYEILKSFETYGFLKMYNQKAVFNQNYHQNTCLLDLHHLKYVEKNDNETHFDLKVYLKAKIANIIKKKQEVSEDGLEISVKSSIDNDIVWCGDQYKLAMDELRDADIIFIKDGFVYYDV